MGTRMYPIPPSILDWDVPLNTINFGYPHLWKPPFNHKTHIDTDLSIDHMRYYDPTMWGAKLNRSLQHAPTTPTLSVTSWSMRITRAYSGNNGLRYSLAKFISLLQLSACAGQSLTLKLLAKLGFCRDPPKVPILTSKPPGESCQVLISRNF